MKFKARASFAAFLLLMMLALPVVAAGTETSQTTTGTSPAESSDNVKSYIISEIDGQETIFGEPDTAMFWEYPELPAGQQRQGTLEIDNQSDKEMSISLDRIDLPYEDIDALTYLASLHITVSQNDGTTLYDGSFSGINDTNGLSIHNISLKPNESLKYRITMRCAFTYTSDPTTVNSRVAWEFNAVPTAAAIKTSSNIPQILLIAAIALLAVGVILALIQWMNYRKMIKYKKH